MINYTATVRGYGVDGITSDDVATATPLISRLIVHCGAAPTGIESPIRTLIEYRPVAAIT